jgi:DNA-binding transcriptional MerR regulator
VTAEVHRPGDVRYRADELAAEVGISVQALRSYQSKGLLPPPRHVGRVAWYGPHHRERLIRIRLLKQRGWSLRMVAEALGDDGRSPAGPAADDQAVLRLGDVAERSGVPVEVLRAMAASRLLRPHHLGDGDLYSEADVRFVRHVLTLLGVGLSLDDLMRIARPLLAASDDLGREAVTAWDELVGTRLRRGERAERAGAAGAGRGERGDGNERTARPERGGENERTARGERGERGDDDLAARVAESLRALAAIVGQLVAYQVERAVLDAAQADIADHGTRAERDALVRALTTPASE